MRYSINNRQRGFTLIELVVVIVILGILAAFAIPRFINISSEARVSAVNGLAGSVRSSSALLHGMSLAQNNPATLSLEGVTINMVNGYPAGTAANGIGAAMSTLDGFHPPLAVVGPPASVSYVPVSLANNAVTTCTVTYTEAPGPNTAPAITINVSAC